MGWEFGFINVQNRKPLKKNRVWLSSYRNVFKDSGQTVYVNCLDRKDTRNYGWRIQETRLVPNSRDDISTSSLESLIFIIFVVSVVVIIFNLVDRKVGPEGKSGVTSVYTGTRKVLS